MGVDPGTGRLVLVRRMSWRGRSFEASAVAALLPPGYTRTFLPGEVKDGGSPLPQWAYAAAGWLDGPVAWGLRTDRRSHWSPDRFSTADLPRRVEAHLARFPKNRVLLQLRTCALEYRCFTSQNVFYERDEGALPASASCNASCVGCISKQPLEGPPSSHQRIAAGPAAEEMAEVGAFHLSRANGRVMVSFGQGCEGEPLTRFREIAAAIRLMRQRTRRGSININTNGSLPRALEALIDAGLDSVRVSLNSASPDLYEAYFRPHQYQLAQVEETLERARRRGIYVALNLLLFPGVSDRRGEVEALGELIRRHRVEQLQARSLCIDPMQFLEATRGLGAQGPPLGIRRMLAELRQAAPWLRVGNFARGIRERTPRLTSAHPKAKR